MGVLQTRCDVKTHARSPKTGATATGAMATRGHGHGGHSHGGTATGGHGHGERGCWLCDPVAGGGRRQPHTPLAWKGHTEAWFPRTVHQVTPLSSRKVRRHCCESETGCVPCPANRCDLGFGSFREKSVLGLSAPCPAAATRGQRRHGSQVQPPGGRGAGRSCSHALTCPPGSQHSFWSEPRAAVCEVG